MKVVSFLVTAAESFRRERESSLISSRATLLRGRDEREWRKGARAFVLAEASGMRMRAGQCVAHGRRALAAAARGARLCASSDRFQLSRGHPGTFSVLVIDCPPV